jgi:hypothetical protein
MTENTAARKPRATPAKTTPAARKPAAQKKAPVARSAKPAASAKAKPEMPAAIPVKPGKKAKKEKKVQEKSKVVRDSFTMPQNDYDKIAELKQVCQKAGLHVKKSELLRAGLHALSKLTVPQLERVIVQLAPIKTGRPKKS